MEFKLTRLESGVAVFNFEELRADLIKKLKRYTFVVVKDVELLKKQRADLNKLSKLIESKRIEVKKAIMKSYETVFEPQCKELVGLIKDVNEDIDKRIKKAEQEEREEKYLVVVELWNGFGFDLVTLDQIFQNEWLNKSASESKIKGAMQDIIVEIRGNLALLDSTSEPDTLKAKYLATLNIEQTMAQYKAEQEAKARLQPKPIDPTNEVEVVEIVAPVKEKMQSVDIQVIATESQIIKLRKVLETNGYTFKQLTDIIDYVG